MNLDLDLIISGLVIGRNITAQYCGASTACHARHEVACLARKMSFSNVISRVVVRE